MDKCRICSTMTGTTTATVTAARATSTWVKCAGCGVEHIDPYPSEADLATYYDDDYADNDNYAVAGFSVSLRTRFAPEYRDALNAEYQQSMTDLGVTLDGSERIVDFGCAEGVFLDYLAGVGHDPAKLTGVDLSPKMVAVVVQNGYAAQTTEAPTPTMTDLITMWDVLEHIPSPVDTLTTLGQALAPDGRILIQTPRMGLLSAVLGERFEHYLPMEHVHLFPRETLEKTAESAGLKVVAAQSFGANAPVKTVPHPFKRAFDELAKKTDEGATQLLLLARR